VASRQTQPATELVLGVPDMDCANCARRISERLEKLDGVSKVDTRIVAKDVRVEFDPALTAEGTLEDAVRSLGYTVERDGRESQTVERQTLWRSAEAFRTYASGTAIALGLLLRLLGASPLLATVSALPGILWRLDVGAVLFVFAALIGGLNFFSKGLRAARMVRLDMNFLMTVAIFGALAVGEFVEAGSIAFLFGLAELLERHSVERARRSIEQLLNLAPATARVQRNGEVLIVPVETLEPGDIVQVLPGEKVPIDGVVLDGVSAVDQSPITGESMPVNKSPSDTVYAGTMNHQGYLEIEAAKRAGDTTLAHIIHLVEEAEASRAPSERFVDVFARYYTPAVTILAVTVMLVTPLVIGASFSTWFVRGLTLLVISCPCALVISLTKGELRVVDMVVAEDSELATQDLLAIASAIEARSEHPIAEAIRRQAEELDANSQTPVSDFEAVPGRGARARLNGSLFQIGRPEFFGDLVEAWRSELDQQAAAGNTPICVGTESSILGLIAVADSEREEAARVIEMLHGLGVQRIVMLTGDHEATARTLAEKLGVDEFHAGLLPGEKAVKVREMEEQLGALAMIGDGVNDAPALAAATIGVAMGAMASDVALETADVAIMTDDLSCLPYLFRLARRSHAVIRENIFASIAIKFSLAAGVIPGWVNLITAVLVGDMGASLAVTGNALRLARLGRRSTSEDK
jgi:Cd2+/Zn2+-exporting ATPase